MIYKPPPQQNSLMLPRWGVCSCLELLSVMTFFPCDIWNVVEMKHKGARILHSKMRAY